MMNQRNQRRLTESEMVAFAPSIASQVAIPGVSSKYSFLSTLQIAGMMKDLGWYPVQVQEQRANKIERRGFQKHLIRFQHDSLQLGDEFIQAILFNSHDRSCAYRFDMGVYRLVCSNGMVVGDSFQSFRVKHIAISSEKVMEASYRILDEAPAVIQQIGEMKKIDLTNQEKTIFAESAMELFVDDNEKFPFDPNLLLKPKRYNDAGDTLWQTLNVIQENVIKGGTRFYDAEARKMKKTRKVAAIDKNYKLNKALYTLAEKMAELK
jgi:hypothetical protein